MKNVQDYYVVYAIYNTLKIVVHSSGSSDLEQLKPSLGAYAMGSKSMVMVYAWMGRYKEKDPQ